MNHSEEAFRKDKGLSAGAVFYIAQIGELSAHFSEEFKEAHNEIPWREMNGMRNILIHEYHAASPETIWETVTEDIPVLRNLLHVFYKAANHNGYLLTFQVLENGITKPVLAEYVRNRELEWVAHGIYLAKDALFDNLYQLYVLNRRIVFSHETSIFLHGLMECESHVTASALIWKLCETGQAKGFVSALTFANLVYVLHRELDPKKTEEVLKKLSLLFSFEELSGIDLLRAAGLHWNDYEEALQAVEAERMRADFIITRNVKGFKQSKVLALTPPELPARL